MGRWFHIPTNVNYLSPITCASVMKQVYARCPSWCIHSWDLVALVYTTHKCKLGLFHAHPSFFTSTHTLKVGADSCEFLPCSPVCPSVPPLSNILLFLFAISLWVYIHSHVWVLFKGLIRWYLLHLQYCKVYLKFVAHV